MASFIVRVCMQRWGTRHPPVKIMPRLPIKGVELTLNWNDRINEWSYSLSGNFSYNKNYVSKFKGTFKE